MSSSMVPAGLSFELTVPYTSVDDYVRLASEWLDFTSGRLLKAFGWVDIEPAVAACSSGAAMLQDQMWTLPFGIIGDFYISHRGRKVAVIRAGATRSWEKMSARLVDATKVTLSLSAADADASPYGDTAQGKIACSVERYGEAVGYLRLAMSGPETEAARFDARVSALRDFAGSADVTFGHISYWDTLGRTALEDALALDPQNTVYTSRRTLRGYSWVTVMPQQILERLGGIVGLRSSGAFVEVSQLPGGVVWVQATPTWSEYTGTAASAVFEAFRSVLPAGKPRIRPAVTPGGTKLAPQLIDPRDATAGD